MSSKHLFGLQFRPKFTITADLDSKYVLDTIQIYFNCGKVSTNLNKHTAEFLVERLEDLKTIIIPHFINYPVFCGKLHAFYLFREIVTALGTRSADNRTIEGRREMLKKALSMNETTNRKEDRIDFLFSLLGVRSADNKNKVLIPNNISQGRFAPPITSNFISGAQSAGRRW